MNGMKLNEKIAVTSMGPNDTVSLVLENGAIVRIKKTDLANTLADVMRTVSTERQGLFSPADYNQFRSISFSTGVSGGDAQKWYKICSFIKYAYNPVRLLLDYGQWGSTYRTKYDITIVGNDSAYFVTGGPTSGRIGYTEGDQISVYAKISSACSLIGLIAGNCEFESRQFTYTEPTGIIYI